MRIHSLLWVSLIMLTSACNISLAFVLLLVTIHEVLSISTDSVSVMVLEVTTLRVAVATKSVPASGSVPKAHISPSCTIAPASFTSSAVGVKVS